MIDERTLELIHGELDGANTPDQQAELGRILAASAEARAMREKMAGLFAIMHSVPEGEPPADLNRKILNALPATAPRPSMLYRLQKTITETISFSHHTPHGRSILMKQKVIIGLAAVLIIAVGIVALTQDWPPKGDTQGTIGAAKKYRSEQVNDKDVVVGSQNGSSTTNSTQAPEGAANQQATAADQQATSANQQATSVNQQATSANQQATSANQQAVAADQKATAGNQQATAADMKSVSDNQKATAADQKATAGNQKSTAADQKATAGSQKSTAADQKATAGNQKSTAADQKATAGNQKSTAADQKATAGNQKATAGNQKAVNGNQKAVNGNQKAVNGNQKSTTVDQKASGGNN